jgi:prephenate dehydrogenase
VSAEPGSLLAQRVALLGCGHIGGSLALALRGKVGEIVGHDADTAAATRALERGICDRFAATAAGAAAGADLVILAVPVRSIGPLAAEIAAALVESGGGGAVVTDVGSTKAGVVRAGETALGACFVGGHPIAGTERAGPDAADARLFAGRRVLLTPTPRTDPAALALVQQMWRATGANPISMDAAVHDRLMATISHLPHVVAYALAGAIGGAPELAGFTGGGYADTTRIASTPPRMWIDVFLENRAPLLDLIDHYANHLAALRRAIDAGDAAEIERILSTARAARAGVL